MSEALYGLPGSLNHTEERDWLLNDAYFMSVIQGLINNNASGVKKLKDAYWNMVSTPSFQLYAENPAKYLYLTEVIIIVPADATPTEGKLLKIEDSVTSNNTSFEWSGFKLNSIGASARMILSGVGGKFAAGDITLSNSTPVFGFAPVRVIAFGFEVDRVSGLLPE